MENACYHLMVRGNQKQKVFCCKDDYLVYLSLVGKFKRKYGFKLYAYCLMPNHVHLLGEISSPPALSKFMHDLSRTYTLYFNNKYEKVGHLWQGRFKSKVVVKDSYLYECIKYIEGNPVRSGLSSFVSDYDWSSYHIRVLDKEDKLLDHLGVF